jgi:hypothetical protein
MSDKGSLSHRLQTENSISNEKPLKEDVNNYYYNYNNYSIYFFSQIKILKTKISIKQIIKYQIQFLIIVK